MQNEIWFKLYCPKCNTINWHNFLATEEAEKYFGVNWEYANIGITYDIRAEGHLVGLKMIKELDDKLKIEKIKHEN